MVHFSHFDLEMISVNDLFVDMGHTVTSVVHFTLNIASECVYFTRVI